MASSSSSYPPKISLSGTPVGNIGMSFRRLYFWTSVAWWLGVRYLDNPGRSDRFIFLGHILNVHFESHLGQHLSRPSHLTRSDDIFTLRVRKYTDPVMTMIVWYPTQILQRLSRLPLQLSFITTPFLESQIDCIREFFDYDGSFD